MEQRNYESDDFKHFFPSPGKENTHTHTQIHDFSSLQTKHSMGNISWSSNNVHNKSRRYPGKTKTLFSPNKMSVKPTPTYLPYPLDLLRSSKKHDQPTNRPFSYKTPWEGRFGGHHLPTKSRRLVDPLAISGLERSEEWLFWILGKGFAIQYSIQLGKGKLGKSWKMDIFEWFWFFLCHPNWKILQPHITFVSSKVSFWIYHLLNRGEPQPPKKTMWTKAPSDFVPPELMVQPPGVKDYNHHQLALSWDTDDTIKEGSWTAVRNWVLSEDFVLKLWKKVSEKDNPSVSSVKSPSLGIFQLVDSNVVWPSRHYGRHFFDSTFFYCNITIDQPPRFWFSSIRRSKSQLHHFHHPGPNPFHQGRGEFNLLQCPYSKKGVRFCWTLNFRYLRGISHHIDPKVNDTNSASLTFSTTSPQMVLLFSHKPWYNPIISAAKSRRTCFASPPLMDTWRGGWFISIYDVHFGKLTWKRKIYHFEWYLPGKMRNFHGYVSLPEGR